MNELHAVSSIFLHKSLHTLQRYLCRIDCKRANKFRNYRSNHSKHFNSLVTEIAKCTTNRKRKQKMPLQKVSVSFFDGSRYIFFDVELFDQNICYRLASKISTAEEWFLWYRHFVFRLVQKKKKKSHNQKMILIVGSLSVLPAPIKMNIDW